MSKTQGLGKRMNEKARSLISKYFDPDKVGNNAGIEFLNRAGFLKWRLDNMVGIEPESMVSMDANYNKITLPWLNIKKNSANFEKFDYFKDLFNYYEGVERAINLQKRKELVRLNRSILAENLVIRNENAALDLGGENNDHLKMPEKKYVTLEDLKDIPIDPELEEFRETLRGILSYASSIILGLSFANPDDNVSLIVNKPILMQEGRPRIVEGGGGTKQEDKTREFA